MLKMQKLWRRREESSGVMKMPWKQVASAGGNATSAGNVAGGVGECECQVACPHRMHDSHP